MKIKVLHFFLIYFVVIVLTGSLCFNVLAESLLIKTKRGERGHGWLFGAPQDGKSWVVAPAHVIRSPESGQMETFYFINSKGISGETETPILCMPTGRKSIADKEAQDLAFARVVNGCPDGHCRSRLGLNSFAYETAIIQHHNFSLLSLFPTSAGVFPVTLHRRSVDILGGAIIDFRLLEKEQSGGLYKGISGAIVTSLIDGHNEPLAMVLRIDDEKKVLRTLRFDYIKQRFNEIWLKTHSINPIEKEGSKIPYKILFSSYTPLDGNLGASSLQHGGGCWSAMAIKGKRTADIVISVDEQKKIEKIKVLHEVVGGTQNLRFWVDQRAGYTESWEYVTACKQEAEGFSLCRVGLSVPRQIRLRFDAKKPIKVTEIRLQ